MDPNNDDDLIAGKYYFIGYQLDNDIETSHYKVLYLLSDDQSHTSFRLGDTFEFAQ